MPQQLPRLGAFFSLFEGQQKVNLHSRIIVLGSAKVGKTAIIEQFLYDAFPVLHSATVEQLYRAEYQVRGSGTLTLDILDTSGSYEFPAMRHLAINSGDAFLLVYSVDDQETFEEVRRLRDMIIQIKNSNNTTGTAAIPAIVVVGNKCDLIDKRVVRQEIAETVICLDWENGYVECSAKENKNIEKIFQELMVQANVPYDVGPAITKSNKQRRRSLPEYPPGFVNRHKGMPKRNSCSLS